MLDGKEVTLGEAKYVAPPLNLKAMRALLPRIKKMVPGALNEDDIDLIVDAMHASLLRNYPGMKRETVEEGLDVTNMRQSFAAIMGDSGLTPGNVTAQAKVTAETSTGDASTTTSLAPTDGPTTT